MSNKSLSDKIKANRRANSSVEKFTTQILNGDIVALSRSITLLESQLDSDRAIANAITNNCLPHSGNSIRIGITGVPGVGKSTFIESFGELLTKEGHKIAVLAIDPSSETSKGSILGDKTRMEQLASNKNAFIRPSPNSGSLGGVADKTREAIILCEAAGFDIIIIETVGVGQSEITVKSMIDFFLLLMLSGAGDELQGIKRGIMEMADGIVITKADGDNFINAKKARITYNNALHLFPKHEGDFVAKAQLCSAVKNEGISEIWDTIESYKNQTKINGWFDKNRKEQDVNWMHESYWQQVKYDFYNSQENAIKIESLEQEIRSGKISSVSAAQKLLSKS